MKLKDFLENIEKMIEADPDILELDVIVAQDDEGNGYDEVYFNPSVGYQHKDGDFTPEGSEDFSVEDGDEVNAICIN